MFVVLWTLQEVVGDVFRQVEGVVESPLDPGGGGTAEVSQGHGHRNVDGSQEPQQDDREQTADGEDDEGGAAVHDGADEEEEAEKREETKEAHGDGPAETLNLPDLLRDVVDHNRRLVVTDLVPDGVNRLESVGDVVEDEVAVLHEVVVSVLGLSGVCLEDSVKQTSQVLFNVFLQHVVEYFDLKKRSYL